MLNVPTLWTVFVINFLALGLFWAYVARSYPTLEEAWFWTASSLVAVVGAASPAGRAVFASIVPLIIGATLMIFAACLAGMGIRRFYDQPANWRSAALITGLSCAGIVFFTVVYDSAAMRMLTYWIGQCLPIALPLKLLFSRQEGPINPGARLAGIIALLIIAIYGIRAGGNLLGFDFTVASTNSLHSFLVLALLFLSTAFNFGFLLMVMDRLRNEVADLALIDDLTGVANRRHLLQRLAEECARSRRGGQPFSLLVIDLDDFKTINDTYGHAAGDACLRHFTLMAQTRLRSCDMLARTGGDEFCIVLPSASAHEAAMVARRVVEVCQRDAAGCAGNDIPVTVSIGVAQWTKEMGDFADQLVACADDALYAAKKNGKNGYAVYDPAPPLLPEQEPSSTLVAHPCT